MDNDILKPLVALINEVLARQMAIQAVVVAQGADPKTIESEIQKARTHYYHPCRIK